MAFDFFFAEVFQALSRAVGFRFRREGLRFSWDFPCQKQSSREDCMSVEGIPPWIAASFLDAE